MSVSEATYRQVALEDPTGRWEWIDGFMRRKPAMTSEHESLARRLFRSLNAQLDPEVYIAAGNVRVRRGNGSYFVPDVTVLPLEYERRIQEHPRTFEVFDDPMPLIVEVWSPSDPDYDVELKLSEYRQRGDMEIWHIHPYDRWLIAWRRQEDGTYTETRHTGGLLHLFALRGVTIDLETLFG